MIVEALKTLQTAEFHADLEKSSKYSLDDILDVCLLKDQINSLPVFKMKLTKRQLVKLLSKHEGELIIDDFEVPEKYIKEAIVACRFDRKVLIYGSYAFNALSNLLD